MKHNLRITLTIFSKEISGRQKCLIFVSNTIFNKKLKGNITRMQRTGLILFVVILGSLLTVYYFPEDFFKKTSEVDISPGIEAIGEAEKIGEGKWINSTHYVSSIFNLKAHTAARDFFVHEDANSESRGAIKLEWLSFEQEGEIAFYVNGEFRGVSYITEQVIKGETFAPCCEYRTILPLEMNTITIISEDCEASFQYIYVRIQ